MIKNSIFILLLVCLFACSSDTQIEERVGFWESSLQTFFSEERTIEELGDWLKANGAKPLRKSEDIDASIEDANDPDYTPSHYYHSWLEDIEMNGYPCGSWHYGLKVWTDEYGNVLKHEVESMGNCL
jgi:hypothetical protein